MTRREREPDLAPDEERELTLYARHPVPSRPDGAEREDGPIEPRPPIVSALGLWWVPMAGLLVACVFLATDHMWRAGAAFAGSFWLAAVIRAVLPEHLAGGLVVRQRWLDVVMLILGGIAVGVSAFTLDLRDLRG